MGDRRRVRIDAVCPYLLIVAGVLMLAGCNPMAAWTNNQSGKAFYRAGRYAEAREEFRRATADSPRNPDYYHNYATASRQAGDPIAAENAYRQALMLDPAHQPSYHGLAVTYLNTGRSAEAHSLLSNWVATQPYSEKPYIEMAWLQQEMGDLTGAERSLAQALQIRPNHPLAMANLGQVYEQTGRSQLALADPIVSAAQARLRGRMEIVYVIADYHEAHPKPCMYGWGARQLTVAPNGDVLPCPAATVMHM